MSDTVVEAFKVDQEYPATQDRPSPRMTATVPDGYTIIGTEVDGRGEMWVLATAPAKGRTGR